jgi:hypothetical protein
MMHGQRNIKLSTTVFITVHTLLPYFSNTYLNFLHAISNIQTYLPLFSEENEQISITVIFREVHHIYTSGNYWSRQEATHFRRTARELTKNDNMTIFDLKN